MLKTSMRTDENITIYLKGIAKCAIDPEFYDA